MGNKCLRFVLMPIMLFCGCSTQPATDTVSEPAGKNWAGNFTYGEASFHRPRTVEELQQIVRAHPQIKALGSRHSFSQIANTQGALISMEHFNSVHEINAEARTVTVGGGIRYGSLAEELHRQGWAIHNLASLPHISVAGAIATATHGSGDRNGNLATQVVALEFVDAAGNVVQASKEHSGDDFYGMVVNLGGLGAVTKVTLAVQPTFQVRQIVYEHLPKQTALQHFDAIMGSAYSVSFFTDWKSDINEVWLKHVAAEGTPDELPREFFGAKAATRDLHPIQELSAEPCTPQMGVAGPWFERLPHFKMGFTPSSGEELQSEFFVPRERAAEALARVFELAPVISPVLQISEIRSVAADSFWMSPAYQQPAVGIHFTWKADWDGVHQVLPQIQTALEPFGAKPHWGKLHTFEPERFQALYPKIADFRRLLREHDPSGKFRNSFLDTYIFAD